MALFHQVVSHLFSSFFYDGSTTITIDSNSCIMNLPNELVEIIFRIVADTWQDLSAPVILSSVCRRWRILAQNIPDLWVNIIVPVHKSPEDCRRWVVEWIERTGDLPISFTINREDRPRHITVFHLDVIIDLLSQYS